MTNAKDFMIEWYSLISEYPSEQDYIDYLEQCVREQDEPIMARPDSNLDGQSHGADSFQTGRA